MHISSFTRKGLFTFAAGALLVSGVHASSFFDDHNDGSLAGWTSYGNRQWSESGTNATPLCCKQNEGFLINNNSVNSNGTLTVKMTADQWNGNRGGIVFRWTSASSYYYVSVQPGNNYSNSIRFAKNTTAPDSGVVIAKNFAMNATFTLKIVMQGSKFDFYIDNVLKGTITDNAYPSGKIGYAYSAEWNDYIDFNTIEWTESQAAVPLAPSNVTVNTASDSQLNVSWNDNSSDETGFRIERAVSGGSYTEIATVASNSTSFQNTGLQPNTVYNYRIRAYNDAGNSGYSPVVSSRTSSTGEKFLIIVSSTLYRYGTISSDIKQYQDDILKQGYTSKVIRISKTEDQYADEICPTEKELKNMIKGYYASGLEGFLLVGSARDIPTAYWRYHEKSTDWGYTNDPTDLYYADIHDWVDLDNNGVYETYHSKYENGKWIEDKDKPANPSNPLPLPELMFGRISTDTTITSIDTQAELISRYFKKNHYYRVNGSPLTAEQSRRSLFLVNDCYSGAVRPEINVQNAGSDMNVLAGFQLLFPERIKAELAKGYTHAQIVTHSGSDCHNVYSWADEEKKWIGFTPDDLKSSDPKVSQVNIFGCYGAQFNVPNFGETYLFYNDYTLSVTGSSGGWGTWMDSTYYKELNAGTPVGKAFCNWMLRYRDGGAPKGVLHGDPLITYPQVIKNKPPMFSEPLFSHEATAGSTFSMLISAVDPDNDPVYIELKNLPEGATFDGKRLTWTPSMDLVGTNDTITAIVTDNHNNKTIQSFTIYVSHFVNGLLTATNGWELSGNANFGATLSDEYYNPQGVKSYPLTTSDTWGVISQTVTVKSNTQYRFSFYSLNKLTKNPQSAKVRIEELNLDIPLPGWSENDFSYSSTSINTGAHTNLTISIQCGNASNLTSGNIYVTMFRLVSLPAGLHNESFEMGTSTPQSWTEDKWNLQNSIMSWENTGRSGKCVSITNTGENDARWIQQIDRLTPGTVYRFSGWVKGESISNNGSTGANICLMGGFESSSEFFSGTGTFDWTKVEFTFTAPSSGSVTVGTRLGFYGSTVTGKAWFDDLEIVPVQ